MTWTQAGSPYTGAYVTIAPGATVTAEPGVLVKLYQLTVNGALNASGCEGWNEGKKQAEYVARSYSVKCGVAKVALAAVSLVGAGATRKAMKMVARYQKANPSARLYGFDIDRIVELSDRLNKASLTGLATVFGFGSLQKCFQR